MGLQIPRPPTFYMLIAAQRTACNFQSKPSLLRIEFCANLPRRSSGLRFCNFPQSFRAVFLDHRHLSPWVLSHQRGQAPLMLKMPLLLHFLFPSLPPFSAPITDQSS